MYCSICNKRRIPVDRLDPGEDPSDYPLSGYSFQASLSQPTKVLLISEDFMNQPDQNGAIHEDPGLAMLAMSGSADLDTSPPCCRFDSSSGFAAAASAHLMAGFRYSAALSAYSGTKSVDVISRSAIHAAVATGIWAFDAGSELVILDLDLSDQTVDAMVSYGDTSPLGLIIHSTAGTQLMATGHHMADNALAVRQFAGCVGSALPSADEFPRPEDEAACVASYYISSKQVRSRGSIAALVTLHTAQERAGRITLRALGPREGTAAYRLASVLLRDLLSLYPGG